MHARPLFAVACAVTLAVACSSSSTSAISNDAGGASDAGSSSNIDGATSANTNDASSQSDANSDAAIDAGGCGEFTNDNVYTCSKDGNSRGKCPDGQTLSVETCARGCLRSTSSGVDSTCLTTTDNWSCTGSTSSVKSTSGDYYLTAFGCWTDANGVVHTDTGDNCIPGCLAQAQKAGVCTATSSGPDCEESVTWYTADSTRFGCLARVRITNPLTGAAVVAVVLDAGPSCSSVEDQVDKGVVDASGRVDRQLFGSDEGYSDKALVHVVEVDPSTPLGPQ